MAYQKDKEIHPDRNPVLRLVQRIVSTTTEFHGGKFFVRKEGRLFSTPLLVTLVIIETTDVIFAVDSIPAIFAITDDPFIVYTSSVFAILGLRALYFAMAGLIKLFRYLHYGLAAILVFVGLKMLFSGVYQIPAAAALAVIGAIMMVTILLSLYRRPKASV